MALSTRLHSYLGPFGEELAGGARVVDLGVGVVVGLQGLVAPRALGRHERQDHVDFSRPLGGAVNVDLLARLSFYSFCST